MNSHDARDAEMVEKTHNTARYFIEKRHVSWILLVGTICWGIFGYLRMPKLKDPVIEVRQAVAIVPWPGASPLKIEDLVTRKLETKMAENSKVEKIESTTRGSTAVVYVTIQEGVADVGKEFDDIKGKLDSIHDLPEGAGPITFIKDFGDTAALMLTVASPKVSEIEIALRARTIAKSISAVRPAASKSHAAVVVCFPAAISSIPFERVSGALGRELEKTGIAKSSRAFQGAGFVGLDIETDMPDDQLRAKVLQVARQSLRLSELHPDVWQPAIIRDLNDIEKQLTAVAGDKYSYRELERQTDLLRRHLLALPIVSKVARSGVLGEKIFLEYSQEKLAAYALDVSKLKDIISARNISVPGGVVEIGAKNLSIDPSGELHDESEIGGIIITTSAKGAPVYLRDVVDVVRTYDSPPRFLNSYTTAQKNGLQTSRAITLAIQMRRGQQIHEFGQAIDKKLEEIKPLLPEGLIMARTSDQPLQVEENVSLFMSSLYEAIALVVIVALIGFWEWRSALLMALCIPLTLAMTFGMMAALGLDVQQVSIASLIIALGLLVDDPVVAGDAIKRSIADGWKPLIAAWLGPTKLAKAIMFATITNIVAYLPFVLLKGDTGTFIFSLPVVLTCSLVASRIVSMTFLPLLGYYLLKAEKRPDKGIEKQSKVAEHYYKVGHWAIDNRKAVLGGSVVILLLAIGFATRLKSSFFPNDLSYLSYVDVWLPEDAPLSSTKMTAAEVETVIAKVAEEFGKEQSRKTPVLHSLTSFIGGGGPRFWFSVTPEMQQINYAQILIQVNDKHDTAHLVPLLQKALSERIAGALVDVRQLETGKPVGIPVAVRIVGEDVPTLRRIAAEAKKIFRSMPAAFRARDDWGAEAMKIRLNIDPDRANLIGLTNYDIAASSASAMNGYQVSTLRDANLEIPIITRLRSSERARLGDIGNLYIHSRTGQSEVPLAQVASLNYSLETAKIRRRNHFRTITVSTFPGPGYYSSEVIAQAKPELDALAAKLPPGYRLEIAGEKEEQVKGFKNLALVLIVSVLAIFVALVIQFQNSVKPMIVFAAIPFGVAGALVLLALMGSPFGFMAFLGIISLIGVIVSHIIVLFDFIEEKREEGESLRDALLDAGIVRLRPVLITVGATVLGLFPLALHGGPLWEPLCYAQIGGLTVATFLTLLLVPVIYSIFVLDLKWVSWDEGKGESHAH